MGREDEGGSLIAGREVPTPSVHPVRRLATATYYPQSSHKII
jgi:hypothetical protein